MPALVQPNSNNNLDADEMELAALEESLKQLSTLSSSVSGSLDKISSMNLNAINTINPLITKIDRLKLQQKNIQQTSRLVDEIKVYAGTIKDTIFKLTRVEHDLNSTTKIKEYTGFVLSLMATKRELIDKQLDTYKGLMKDLDYNIHNAEVNMKYELQGKIRMITTIKDSRQQGDIINQSSLIYNFMDQQLELHL
ncbi:unnamed protein product [Ambrosiozyma monospora]|uniref:Unnamed protein product n=1 Tax=Ambrosiozyma monospora TaxID=43982 RepID=A0ACB5U0L0_AMBMO|nr:unnamed protein product [Ambrosiozyma monospora]